LLIADEPTTALDVTIQAEILDLLRSLQSEIGTTVILVTHDLGVVSDMCSRVAVMYAAQIVEVGDTADLLSNPSHPYTLSLMGAVPGMTARGGRLSAVEGTVPSPQAWPVGCRFANRCPVAIPECRERPVPLLSDGERLRRCIREPSVGRAAIVVPELAQAES
ncbi:MAG TPA: oligopeptide/dipeptide ABC transporter ATP-binding protein, partial [Candidatus Limnocylindrales bacterium]